MKIRRSFQSNMTTLRTRPMLEHRSSLGHLSSKKHKWLTISQNNHRPANFWKFWKTFFLICGDIYVYTYRDSSWHHILKISHAVHRNLPVGDNRTTVNTSTALHISDQSGTENACKTLLCWFIVMLWVLVCNNMYRYERHFGSIYHNTTMSWTVSIASSYGSTQRIFYWNTTTGNNSSTDGSLLRKMWKSNVKNICHVGLSEWNQTTWYFEEFLGCTIAYHTCQHTAGSRSGKTS